MANITGKQHAKNQAFAIAHSLQSRLQACGLSVDLLWEWVKSMFGVSSRSDISERQWVILSARLSAAQHNSNMFAHLCDSIKAALHTCRVYRTDSKGFRISIYTGFVTPDIPDRCQAYADKSGCNVDLHNADGKDGLQIFTPAEYAYDPDCPPFAPIDKTTAARLFEIHIKDNTTQYIEIPFPDTARLREWCREYVHAYGFDIVVTDLLGQNELMRFEVDKS